MKSEVYHKMIHQLYITAYCLKITQLGKYINLYIILCYSALCIYNHYIFFSILIEYMDNLKTKIDNMP